MYSIRFTQPSTGEVIYFKEPTVKDCIDFAGINQAFEEEYASEYLNMLQAPEELSDSRLWTANDRISALWLVWVTINDDPYLRTIYPCSHCGDQHEARSDLRLLDREYVIRDDMEPQPFKLGGLFKKLSGVIQPLRGYHMEHLERMRQQLLDVDEDTPQGRRLLADVRLTEIASMIVFDKEEPETPDNFKKLLAGRKDKLLKLPKQREYKQLVEQVVNANFQALRHGIATDFIDGVAHIILPAATCKTYLQENKESADSPSTNPLARFQYSYFIPEV